MKDQVLSIEQMQKLKDLGVDISKASMCYVFFESDGSKYTDIVVHDESCYEMACMNPMPTFTLQDIIELMPNCIIHPEYAKCFLNFGKKYICYTSIHSGTDIGVKSSDSILGNAYNMLVWLAENKYI